MGIGIPALSPEELLHPFGDQRQGDEFRAGRECEEHRPRGSGKDVPVAEGCEAGDQEWHDDETEQDRGCGKGDEEYLELDETLDGQGPGRYCGDDKDADRKGFCNDMRHPVERLQQDPEKIHDRAAPVVQHEGKAQEQAEEHGRRNNPVGERRERICRDELVDEVDGCCPGQLLGAEKRGFHPGGKCQLERKISYDTDYPEQQQDQERLEGDGFCGVPLQAPDPDDKGEGNGRKDRDLPDLDESIAEGFHQRDKIPEYQPGDDPEDEPQQYPGSEVQAGQSHDTFSPARSHVCTVGTGRHSPHVTHPAGEIVIMFPGTHDTSGVDRSWAIALPDITFVII